VSSVIDMSPLKPESAMCPFCLTTATVIAASTTSGAGVLGVAAVKLRAWRWLRRCWPARGG